MTSIVRNCPRCGLEGEADASETELECAACGHTWTVHRRATEVGKWDAALLRLYRDAKKLRDEIMADEPNVEDAVLLGALMVVVLALQSTCPEGAK